MGMFEAAVTPLVASSPGLRGDEYQSVLTTFLASGLTLMTGFWYTRREIPLRQCIW